MTAKDQEGEMLGLRAAFRWLWGTNASMDTPAAQEEADMAVGECLHRSEQSDPIANAEMKVEAMMTSQARFNRVVPARSLSEAVEQMFPVQGGRE